MAVDIGSAAVEQPFSIDPNRTAVSKHHPAEAAGRVVSVEVWCHSETAGLRIGTFYPTNGDRLKCRDSEAIAGTIPPDEKVTKVIDIAVEIGDYIGFFYTSGYIDHAVSGGAGSWDVSGEYIDPDDEADYTAKSGWLLSIGGYIEEAPVGWTGKISGVTNPAKIMGVDVANIAKVKGVVSG